MRIGDGAPGGEDWGSFRARIEAVLMGVIAECRRSALIVCHGGVIRAALDGLIGLSPQRIVPVEPASLTVLVQDGPGFRLGAFNVMPHFDTDSDGPRAPMVPRRPPLQRG